MRKTFCGILLLLATVVGYRVAIDYLEDSRDFR